MLVAKVTVWNWRFLVNFNSHVLNEISKFGTATTETSLMESSLFLLALLLGWTRNVLAKRTATLVLVSSHGETNKTTNTWKKQEKQRCHGEIQLIKTEARSTTRRLASIKNSEKKHAAKCNAKKQGKIKNLRLIDKTKTKHATNAPDSA